LHGEPGNLEYSVIVVWYASHYVLGTRVEVVPIFGVQHHIQEEPGLSSLFYYGDVAAEPDNMPANGLLPVLGFGVRE